jgi:predicted MPP superfamily phosphohydrolase
MAGVATLAGIYAWQIEPFWLEFVKVKMPIRNLPKDLEGKTLMQISDIHVGKRFDHRYIIESLRKATELSPDFVVYTGDYVSTYKDQVHYGELKEVLNSSVKGKLGTVGILGNHDYGRNWSQAVVADNICGLLLENGITVLRNEQIKIGGLNIIGLDDYWGLNFKPGVVMRNYEETEANIILSH